MENRTPEELAKEMGVKVSNLYNIKKRIFAMRFLLPYT